MQACDYAYVGEHGMPLDLRCGIELAGATQISIEVRKPDGSAVAWAVKVHGLVPAMPLVVTPTTLERMAVA